MMSTEMKQAQLRHDLRSLIEPLEIVAKLVKSGKTDQAVKIQEAAIELLKKSVKALEPGSSEEKMDSGRPA